MTPHVEAMESVVGHPIVQGARRMITSSPVGTLAFVVASMAYFLVFGVLFSSWEQFKQFIRGVELEIA